MRRNFIIIFTVILVFSTGLYAYLVWNDNHNKTMVLETELSSNIEFIHSIITKEFESINNDLNYLSRNRELREVANTDGNYSQLADEYYIFAESEVLYDQIRFIDVTGMERVRVNYNYGDPVIVDEADLQNKSDRYYFTETIKLTDGEIFASPLDLNVENGVIEEPYKPMIRFATPIYCDVGELKGIVVANYLGENMIELIDLTIADTKIFTLLNDEGYWLNANEPEDEWGFMFPEKTSVNFANRYPEDWAIISTSDTGQYITNDYYVVYTTIYPLREIQSHSGTMILNSDTYFWKLVSYLPRDEFRQLAGINFPLIYRNYALIVGLITITSYTIAYLYTQRQRLQQEQIQLQIELREETVRAEEAIETERVKTKLLNTAAHEIRTPLAAIKGYIEIIESEIQDQNYDTIPTYFKVVGRNVTRLETLTSNLLDMFSLESGEIEYKPTKTAWSELLSSLSSDMKPILDSKQQTLNIEIEPENLSSILDTPRITQVLRNLVDNAHKFSEKNAEITIKVIHGADETTVTVTDQGVGIPSEDMEKLFQAFPDIPFRNPNQGPGLGLNISKGLIELHGGKIYAESKEGKGSVFTFTVPDTVLDQ